MKRTGDTAADAARPARDLFSWIPLALAIPVVAAAFAGGGFFAVWPALAAQVRCRREGAMLRAEV
jgi:hypothetical protein